MRFSCRFIPNLNLSRISPTFKSDSDSMEWNLNVLMFNVDLNLFIYLFSDHRVHTAFIHWTLAFTLSFATKGLSPRDTLCHGIRVLSSLLDVKVVVIMKRRWRKGKGRIFRKGCDFADSGEILSAVIWLTLLSFQFQPVCLKENVPGKNLRPSMWVLF